MRKIRAELGGVSDRYITVGRRQRPCNWRFKTGSPSKSGKMDLYANGYSMEHVGRRLLYWEGSSKKDFMAFPEPVQKDMGVSLFIVQLGRTPSSAKPWKGLGAGVYEVVDNHLGDTFRAVYAVRLGDDIHVLHAFQKKSKSGIGTPQQDVELIEKRLKSVMARLGLDGR